MQQEVSTRSSMRTELNSLMQAKAFPLIRILSHSRMTSKSAWPS